MKKVVSLVLILIICAVPATAFDTDKLPSRDEAVAWAQAQGEQRARWVEGNRWGAQSISLVWAYSRELWGWKMPDWGSVHFVRELDLSDGWEDFRNRSDFLPEPGDIFICRGVDPEYGHMGIVLSSTVKQATIVDQNGGASWNEAFGSSAAVRNITWEGLFRPYGFIRPRFAEPDNTESEYINRALELGFVPELMQAEYESNITRGEFCVLAVGLYEYISGEITGRIIFDDASDINIAKAAAIGIAAGVGNNKFEPDDWLSREQAAVMLARLAESAGLALPEREVSFDDSEDIASWAVGSVGSVTAAGIMQSGDSFAPKEPCTRGQAVAAVMRLFDYFDK